jgi:di/tripeptidase
LALKIKARQAKEDNRVKKKEEKQLMKIARAKATSLNMINANEETELFSFNKHKKDLAKVGYISSDEEMTVPKGGIKGEYKTKDIEETEDNIAYLYEQKQQKDHEYNDKAKAIR